MHAQQPTTMLLVLPDTLNCQYFELPMRSVVSENPFTLGALARLDKYKHP